MSIIKYTIVINLLFFSLKTNIFSGGGELWIYNKSSSDVWVHVYPISMVFNNDSYGTNGRNYCLLGASKVMEGLGVEKYFINGANENDWYFKILSNQAYSTEWGFDGVPGSDANTKGTISFGRWQIDFYESENINGNPVDYCILDYDFGYLEHNSYYPNCAMKGDVILEYVNYNQGYPRIKYVWGSCQCEYQTPFAYLPANRILLERNRCPGQTWNPNIGDFKWNNGSPWNGIDMQRAPNLYTIFPQDPRRDCVPEVYQLKLL